MAELMAGHVHLYAEFPDRFHGCRSCPKPLELGDTVTDTATGRRYEALPGWGPRDELVVQVDDLGAQVAVLLGPAGGPGVAEEDARLRELIGASASR